MTLRRWFAAIVATGLLLPTGARAQSDVEEPQATPTVKKGPAAEESRENPGMFAPTIGGLTGLFRTVTSDIGGSHTFRVGLHTELFKSSGFLVDGDDNTRFIGTLAISYAPWRYTEMFFNIRSAANNNDRTDPARLDEPVVLALGDFSFGAKGQYPVTPYLGIGGNFAVNFLNSVGGVSPAGNATGAYFGMLASFGLSRLINAWAPQFHLNFGYLVDNSGNLARDDKGNSVFANWCAQGRSCLASLQVEKFGLGINPSRLQLRLGADFPLRRFTKFGVTPIIELAADFATGDTDTDFDNKTMTSAGGAIYNMLQARLKRAPTAQEIRDEIDPKTTMWLTIGARVNPVAGFNVELASDIGVVSPGYGYGPPVVPWNLILGFSYAYDPAPPTRVVTKETVKTVVKEVGERRIVGKFRGRVVNAKTLEPIEGAVVTLPGKDLTGLSTDPDGTFVSYELPAGPQNIMVRHPDFQLAKLQVTIKQGAITAQDVKLEPAAPKFVRVTGKVTDQKGTAVAATIAAAGAETKQTTADAGGSYTLELKPGQYTIAVTADGFLRKEMLANLAGPAITADFSLSARPKRSLVTVTKKEIVIKKQIHFGTSDATILPDSQQLLDSIVDALLANANIKKLEIAGHTDNRGKAETNLALSQARADAVKDYLVKNGVAADRLVAKGYGQTKPKGLNITPAQRARNRRVEFIIVEQ